MKTENREEIERAAQKMLDDAGQEQVKRFLESYEDGAAMTPRMKAPHTVEVTIPTPDTDDEEPDLMDGIRDTINSAGGRMNDEEKALLLSQCEEYLNSATFTTSIATKRAICKRANSELVGLQMGLNNRALDFEHGLDLANLAAALTLNTKLNVKIPVPKMPKELGRELKFNTTAPLTTPKRHVICRLNDCLIDLAAFAHHFKSEAERDFKAAYLLTLKTAGGPRAEQEDVARPFPEKVANRIVELFSTGYANLFADATVSDRHDELWEEE